MSLEVHHDEHLGGRSLLDIFDKMSWKEWCQRVSHGLKQPRDTGEHKWAKTELTRRVLAPLAAILVPL
ncbi:MAG: hypothetical protein GWM98_20100, partial [Nitrospinaceae bacterium]|nr:hypothetical protein [Nitrospinaceae bacterium]